MIYNPELWRTECCFDLNTEKSSNLPFLQTKFLIDLIAEIASIRIAVESIANKQPPFTVGNSL